MDTMRSCSGIARSDDAFMFYGLAAGWWIRGPTLHPYHQDIETLTGGHCAANCT